MCCQRWGDGDGRRGDHEIDLVKEMLVEKEVDVEVNWEVDEVAKDVSILKGSFTIFFIFGQNSYFE